MRLESLCLVDERLHREKYKHRGTGSRVSLGERKTKSEETWMELWNSQSRRESGEQGSHHQRGAILRQYEKYAGRGYSVTNQADRAHGLVIGLVEDPSWLLCTKTMLDVVEAI